MSEQFRLTNKQIREALEHVCNYFDEKYQVFYDDGPDSLKEFTKWVEEFIVEPTNQEKFKKK